MAIKAKKARKRPTNGNDILTNVSDYRHGEAKRKNNPPAKIAAEGTVPLMPKIKYEYSPRLFPKLRFDPSGKPDSLPELMAEAQKRPLTAEETKDMAEALCRQEPWLEWAGKREQKQFEVDPVALHIHERISPQAILRVAARQDVEPSLFADPQLQYQEAVQFYRHEIPWTNRLILGDSLTVMSSLAKREDLSGKVQMIYMDPPYGIRFASNFQPEVGKRDVKDKEQDLTREPEMVRAYRDTWHLGVHSYLTYLRDRLVVAKELLTDSGSIFVQIGDENLHTVRAVLDEVFSPKHFVGIIFVTKTSGFGDTLKLASVGDFLLWYAKHPDQLKYRQLYLSKDWDSSFAKDYKWAEHKKLGYRRALSPSELSDRKNIDDQWIGFSLTATTSQGTTQSGSDVIPFKNRKFEIGKDQHWKTSIAGMQRLISAERIHDRENSLRYVRYLTDFAVVPASNNWADLRWGFDAGEKRYVVQTNPGIVARCILMTTDPGDLVLDPTCGSGTTAYVSEQWGRRWITIDTSRVSIAIARQRLLTSRFEFYQLRDAQVGVAANFKYKTVPHITLKSIAQNTHLDPIFAKHQPVLNKALVHCNAALRQVSDRIREVLNEKLLRKQKEEGRKAISDAERRRWELPAHGNEWEHWQVPYDTDPDWPKPLIEAVKAYRAAWRGKMDEVNASISANAEQEELVDQPLSAKNIIRVSGPFTVEAVQPPEMSLSDAHMIKGEFGGSPEALGGGFEVREVEVRADQEARNAEAYLDMMIRLLRTDGVRFPNNKQANFSWLMPVMDGSYIHAEGSWGTDGDMTTSDSRAEVAVAFGPQYGPVTAKQVEEVIRQASRRGYDHLVIAGFSFDGAAQAVTAEAEHPKLKIHAANIRPDVNPGMQGLLKEQPGSEIFTVFGKPRVRIEGPNKDGEYTVTMEGVDIYNPVDNSITPTKADKVAAWFIDGDYDDRTFCITQAFFPDRRAWDKLSKALDGVVDPERFEALSGTKSLPFPSGKHKCVAVKVIDPRGNEVMSIHDLKR